ncbi:hypothetical protein ACE1TI_10690 [Alteribacillus sp. JSM 102045]|uniref:hypothetical protein n=1 Tax=Alteribacillus sp. JSM 102045 TaxID=1562101 RepID=UPI0035C043B3
MNIVQSMLDKWVEHDETSTALIWEGENEEIRTYDFKELHEWVNRTANGLKK